MTVAGRAFVGGALGALLTLLVHPASRPFFASALPGSRVPPEASPTVLGNPKNLEEAGRWVEVAALRTQQNDRLQANEWKALLRVVRASAQIDPENAFWPQSESWILQVLGDSPGSRTAWLRASRRLSWNDYQVARLRRYRDQLVQQTGKRQSWQAAAMLLRKTDAVASAIRDSARRNLARTALDRPEDLAYRFATLRNGALLRDGSRSLNGSRVGIAMVERASHPPGLAGGATYRRLYVARFEFQEALAAAGLRTEAEAVDRAYRENDGWAALTQTEGASERPRELALAAIVLSALPGALAVAAFFGCVLWAIGTLCRRATLWPVGRRQKAVLASAVAAAGIVFAFTGSWIAALPVSASILTLLASPRTVRSRPPDDYGPLFAFAMTLLAAVAGALVAVRVIGNTGASQTVLPRSGFEIDLLTVPALPIALLAIVLAVAVLVCPPWAFAQRRETGRVLAAATEQFGRSLFLIGLTLAVAAGVAAVPLDRRLDQELTRLTENEPAYTMLQR